jgi:pimeloyl-ACP methyl ester carboxylesterase
MQFGTTPSGDFEWGSNYTKGTGKMFYRVRQLFPFALESGFLPLSDGAKMYRSVAGSGPILVFIHGGTQTSDNWLAQVGHFCTSYRVVIYDLRTFGRSDSGIPAYSPWNFSWAQTNRATIDLLELVNSLTNEPVSICGLSMGSAIAAQFATLYPSKVSKLVLASPWSAKTFPRDSQLQTLNALSNRTMVLVGSQDTWGSKEEAQWAQGQGYSAPVTTLQGADHNMNTTVPDLFNAHVDAFLTGE